MNNFIRASFVCTLLLVNICNAEGNEPYLSPQTVKAISSNTQLSEKNIWAAAQKVEEAENLHTPAWKLYYNILPELIRKYNLKTGCEIGVAFGNHSKFILETTNVKKLYSVDPYRHFPTHEYDDPMNLEQNYFDVLYHKVKDRLASFENRSILLRLPSTQASTFFASGELDFVFLDANHSYKGVKEDLHAWIDKVRPGGIIAGDDYGPMFPGVQEAVDEFFAEKHIPIHKHPVSIKFIYWAQKPE